MTAFVITFLAVFATDIINAYYIKAIHESKALVASTWAVLITLTASIAVINFTEDHTMLLAALLGAFCGTFVAIRFKK